MATLTISVPDEMKRLVEARVQAGRYEDAGDYIRDLIRSDLGGEGDWLTPEIAAAIEEGEASGWSDCTSVAQIIAEERAKFRSA